MAIDFEFWDWFADSYVPFLEKKKISSNPAIVNTLKYNWNEYRFKRLMPIDKMPSLMNQICEILHK